MTASETQGDSVGISKRIEAASERDTRENQEEKEEEKNGGKEGGRGREGGGGQLQKGIRSIHNWLGDKGRHTAQVSIDKTGDYQKTSSVF